MNASKQFWVMATQNSKKAKELVALTGGRVEVKTLRDLGLDDLEIIEDGHTFAENAQKKSETVWAHLKRTGADLMPHWIIADDSGLCVDALGGAPGIRSARYALDAGTCEGDDDNNTLLLNNLRSFPTAQERRAHFACALCAMNAEGQIHGFYGEVHGFIGHALSGAGGFGYDPLFYPDAFPGQTTAEISEENKHAISHRGKAFRALADALLAS